MKPLSGDLHNSGVGMGGMSNGVVGVGMGMGVEMGVGVGMGVGLGSNGPHGGVDLGALPSMPSSHARMLLDVRKKTYDPSRLTQVR
jgi:hypothetical protein